MKNKCFLCGDESSEFTFPIKPPLSKEYCSVSLCFECAERLKQNTLDGQNLKDWLKGDLK